MGFLSGALRFSSIAILAHLVLTGVHPIYRGLTVQFKVFMQLSAATLGGCIFAERRVSEYTNMVRQRNRAMERSQRAWNEQRELQMWLMERDEAAERLRRREEEQEKREAAEAAGPATTTTAEKAKGKSKRKKREEVRENM